ncbi:hypothetical protein VPH35_134668 [Triticum aestivum]
MLPPSPSPNLCTTGLNPRPGRRSAFTRGREAHLGWVLPVKERDNSGESFFPSRAHTRPHPVHTSSPSPSPSALIRPRVCNHSIQRMKRRICPPSSLCLSLLPRKRCILLASRSPAATESLADGVDTDQSLSPPLRSSPATSASPTPSSALGCENRASVLSVSP